MDKSTGNTLSFIVVEIDPGILEASLFEIWNSFSCQPRILLRQQSECTCVAILLHVHQVNRNAILFPLKIFPLCKLVCSFQQILEVTENNVTEKCLWCGRNCKRMYFTKQKNKNSHKNSPPSFLLLICILFSWKKKIFPH